MPAVYKPVVTAESGNYRGAALVGTYSAIIGWTFDDPALRKGLLGFGIRRTDLDPETGERLRMDWLGGYKRFRETDDGKSEDVRSLEAPFQRFRWNDYSLKPERAYLYEVFPMRGKPDELTHEEAPLKFRIRPSEEDPGDLGVFVNRGVTSALAYLARFKNRHPKEVGAPAYKWLSRGLKESLLGFIAATNPGESLHVAIYEFFDHEVAQAFRDAVDRGVDLSIVHDAVSGKSSTKENDKVIVDFGLKDYRTRRTTVKISHNKIVIRLVKGRPREVWTGSANFSENAFNFQTNTALIVRDPDAVKHYEEYFQALTGNPPKAKSKIANRDIMDDANAGDGGFAEKMFFSPISKKEILEASIDLIGSAKSIVMISAPFGMDKSVIDALHANPDDVMEYGLANSTAKMNIESLHRKNTRFFTPTAMKTYMGRSWDAKAFGAHKIHAKTIVVDPWSSNPKVLIGSANFSEESCCDNDENAMLITGNRRLSSIIATEFMRMYDHYKSRYYIDDLEKKNDKIRKENKQLEKQGLKPKSLIEMDKFLESDESWSRTSFDPKSRSHKCRDRIVFAGD